MLRAIFVVLFISSFAICFNSHYVQLCKKNLSTNRPSTQRLTVNCQLLNRVQVNLVGSPPRIQDLNTLFSRRIVLTILDLACYKDQFEALQRLRSCPETIDLVLCSNDGGVEPVHSYYLAFKAPKFWAQIAYQVDNLVVRSNESAEEQHLTSSFHTLHTAENIELHVPRLLVPDISARMLHIVVSTLYANDVKLDYDLCWQLLAMAHKFELDMLADTCLDFLSVTLCTSNCVLLLRVALKFEHRLAKIAYCYILHHFDEVCCLVYNAINCTIIFFL